MRLYILSIVIVMFSLITYTYQNLEYKGYDRAHSCTGECYEEYLRVHGTLSEQMAKQAEAAAADPFSSIRGLWAGCAACHGNEGQGIGVFPALAGGTQDYVYEALMQYKNKETRGAMSATMWAQAGQLSAQEMKPLCEYIEQL